MKAKDLKLKSLPDKPGVYFFKKGQEVLYVGKATSLRDRVRSYFNQTIVSARGPKIVKMVELANRVDFKETDSVLEALILEANLIKKFNPVYNTKAKDDKSFWFVIITKEEWPRLLTARGKDLATNYEPEEIKHVFGPFPHGAELKEAIKIIRKIFPFRDRCLPAQVGELGINKPCFDKQIGLCPGVCSGEISKKEYAKTIKNLTLFFQGKKSIIISGLKKEMNKLAKERKFEEATKKRNQIFALEHIKDVALIKERSNETSFVRIEAYDVAHLAGSDSVGVMIVMVGDEFDKTAYRKFKLKGKESQKGNDLASLSEILTRRFSHPEWAEPDLVVIDGGKNQLNTAKKVLSSLDRGHIPIVSVVKDERHKPKDILGDKIAIKKYQTEILQAGNEVHRFAIAYHRKLRGRMIK